MNAVALRGLLSRKLRTALTAIAILLGVAMIAGTYILTDTINSTFTTIFSTADRHTDAVISTRAPVQSRAGSPSLPEHLLAVVQTTPGVAQAAGEVADATEIYDLQGKSLGAQYGPSLLFSVPPARFRASTLVAGHWPVGNEITVDRSTASKQHLRLGQVVQLATVTHLERFTVAGFTRLGSVSSFGATVVLSAPLATAQRIGGKRGKYDAIDVAATPGVTPQDLVARIKARIPASLRGRTEVKTGQQNAQDQAANIADALSFLTISLLAFGGIAVFVGAFIIFNTFSITVAQRAREFAVLRTLGAMRGQVLRSVILEALILGVGASVVGLVAGLGIARGLSAAFVAFGIDLPNSGLVVQGRTVIVALLVGTLVTLVSSIMPAVRATRVPPLAALREGAQLPGSRWSRFTPYVAAVLAAGGVLFLLLGVFGAISMASQRLSLIGLGAVLLFLGVAMLSPKLIGPLAGVIGWPIERLTRITGRLARENTVRNPARTATTAAALMIGLALVGFVTIFAAELVKSTDDALDRNFAGTFVIQSSAGNLVPGTIAPAIKRVSGVGAVTAISGDNARIGGIGTVGVTAVELITLDRLYRFQWVQGSQSTFTAMGSHGALVDNTFASDHRLSAGSRLRMTTPTGKHDTFTVAAIYRSSAILSGVAIPLATFRSDWQQPRDEVVLAALAPGANPDATQSRIEHLLRTQYPVAQVQSTAQYKAQQQKGVNQLLALIYLLLALSVVVSLFGIINTLVLSVYERTREIGMLRAIGTTRSQIRWMVRWESVITSVIGAVLGLALGILLAYIVTAGLASQQIEHALPLGQLLIWVVVAILFGIVAAAFPARRAAHLDVLQAIAYE